MRCAPWGDAGTLAALDGELIVAFVPSEEDGGQGTLAAIRAGVTGDMAVIAEPSSLDVVVAHAGAITFRLTVPGRAAHASRRTEGVSALDNLQSLLGALEVPTRSDETPPRPQPLMTALGLPYPTIVGIVAGGEWASTVIDRVTADGRYGVRLGQSPADAEAELRACIEAACSADAFLRDHPATVEITGARFASSLRSGRAPAARRASRQPRWPRRAASRAPRRPVRLRHAPVHRGRRHAVRVFGPGDVRVAHWADESVPLDEVVDCARVFAAWVTGN